VCIIKWAFDYTVLVGGHILPIFKGETDLSVLQGNVVVLVGARVVEMGDCEEEVEDLL
jgi:hypothetical protein